MRARLALLASGLAYEHRDILLRDKPAALLQASPKGTVPVLVLPNGQVLEESLDIMLWALQQHDPLRWLAPSRGTLADAMALIAQCDGPFKQQLDAYKYPQRQAMGVATADALGAQSAYGPRDQAAQFAAQLNHRLADQAALFGPHPGLADIAIAPFVRQFAAVQPDWFASQPWPALQAWLADFCKSPAFGEIMQKQALWREKEPAGSFLT